MSAFRNVSALRRLIPFQNIVQRKFANPRVSLIPLRTFSSGSKTIADLEEELASIQITDDVSYSPIVVMNAVKEKDVEDEMMCEVVLAK